MTNSPFGFGTGDPGDNNDNDPDKQSGSDDQGAGGTGAGAFGPGFGAEGFDLSQFGNMLAQLGNMMSEAGKTGDGGAGSINYEMAQKLALQGIPASHPASSVDLGKVRDAVQLAEVWLEGATGFPAATRTVTAWNPRQWVEATMPTWKSLSAPIAERVTTAWTEALPEEVRSQVGPLLGMLGSMGGMSFSTQLGQGLAQLSGEVLTSTDIGLPLGPDGTAALLPRAIAEFSQGLSVDEDQVRLYLAAREAAHHRLYGAAPWLRDRVIALVQAYASAITVDFGEMEDLAQKFDPSDPSSMAELMSGQGMAGGMFEPKITPGQESALRNLETLLALVEGWVDTIVTNAVGDRLPGAVALQETMRRRRASGGPSEQAFENLVGLQMRPRRLRAAAELWLAVGESRGTEGRDALWAHPDLLPGADDLDEPTGFVERDKQFSELLAGLDDVQSLADMDGFDDPEKPTAAGDPDSPVVDDDDEPDAPDRTSRDV
jgi:putative hydrolase